MIDFGDAEKRENEFKENISLIKNFNNTADGRITTMFGPHSVYTASVDLLERVRKEADKYNVGIHIHMNETQKEINDCMEEHDNKRPFELLDSIDFLGDDVVAAHGVWLGENEIKLIKENDVKIPGMTALRSEQNRCISTIDISSIMMASASSGLSIPFSK